MLKFISGLGLSGWIAVALGALLLVQTARIEGFGIWPIKVPGLKAKLADARDDLASVRAELRAISDTRNEQAERTTRTIERTRVIYRDADVRARRVEEAPTAPNCETPPEIIGLDI